MHRIILNLILFTKLTSCQRRLTNGSSVGRDSDTSFVVYIVAAKTTDTDPGWLCGGSIIHPSLVLTSASCLELGTKQMYVISGYRKYIMTEQLEQDSCTRRMRKRIISYCVHKSYATEGDNDKADEIKYKWLKFDIGIARTETPIDFYNANYIKFCSYMPSSIKTNYNSRYERAGSDVVVYGWGHANYYRPVGDLTDYNEQYLKFASSQLIERTKCTVFFSSKYVATRVMNHFLCTDGKGAYNAAGKYLEYATPARKNCHGRRSANNSAVINGSKSACFEDKSYKTRKIAATDMINVTSTRRNGLCQNDHGNPLVRWIGGHPFVIGVASAFRVTKKMQCVGPYLYSSVVCMSLFIHCILEEQKTVKNRRIASQCDDPKRGYRMEETEVDWQDENFQKLDKGQ